MQYISDAIMILSFAITVATFYIKQKRDKKSDDERQKKARADEMTNIKSAFSEFNKEVDSRLDALQMKHEKDIANLREDMIKRDQSCYDRIDEKRREEMQRVHKRLDDFEKQYASEVMARIGKLEGTVSAKMDNLEKALNILQTHLMAK